MNKKMKVSLLKKLKKWEYSELPLPSNYNQNKYALIKTTLNGICSTDVLRSMKTGFIIILLFLDMKSLVKFLI